MEISNGESKATGGGGAKYQESNIGGKEEKDNRTSAEKTQTALGKQAANVASEKRAA
jgi:hypothetical protein